MLTIHSDEFFMKKALEQADIAFQKGEIPVGAVVVCRKTIIAKAHNQTELLQDVTAHAEIIAMTMASNYLGGKYLDECTIFVTLEPCVMCSGALFWGQLGKLVYGASDPKRGFSKHQQSILHPKTKVISGLMENECSMMLKDFFAGKRTSG